MKDRVYLLDIVAVILGVALCIVLVGLVWRGLMAIGVAE